MTTKTTQTQTTPEVALPRLPHSSMPGVHSDRGPLGDALRAMPEWLHAVQALAHLVTIRPEPQRYASLDVELDELVDGAVENRTALDLADALAHARQVTDRLSGQQALDAAFERRTRALTENLDNLVRANRDAIYASLSEHLGGLVTQARDLADVIGIDAGTAVARDKVERWQQAEALFAAARRLRVARMRLEDTGGWEDMGSVTVAELRWLHNPTEVFEHWRAWRIDGELVNPHDTSDTRPLSAPWPDYRYGRPTVDEAERWLAYFAQNREAVPWVPSPGQYLEAAHQLTEYAASLRPSSSRTYEVSAPPPPTYLERSRENIAKAHAKVSA